MSDPSSTQHVLAFEEAEGFGGAFVDLRHIATELRDRGLRVSIARTYDHPCWQAPELEGITLMKHTRWELSRQLRQEVPAPRPIRLAAHGLEMLAQRAPQALRYAAWGRKAGVTAVFLNNGLAFNVLGVAVARLLRVPVYPYFQGEVFPGRLFKALIPAFEHGFAVSEWLAGLTIDAGVPPERLEVLHPGIAPIARPELARPRTRGDGEPVRVGMVGMFTRWKGQLAFLEAFALAAARVPDLEAWLFGATVPGQEAYAAEIHAAIAEAGLGDRVRIVSDRSTPETIYPEVDFTVHSSTSPEPFGRVMIEAMAFGRPVITAGDGGTRESIRDGDTGYLASPADPELVAQRIVTLATDEALRVEMGERAIEDVAQRFTYPGVLEPVLKRFGVAD